MLNLKYLYALAFALASFPIFADSLYFVPQNNPVSPNPYRITVQYGPIYIPNFSLNTVNLHVSVNADSNNGVYVVCNNKINPVPVGTANFVCHLMPNSKGSITNDGEKPNKTATGYFWTTSK